MLVWDSWESVVYTALSSLGGVCTCGAHHFAVVGASQASEKPTSSSRILHLEENCRNWKLARPELLLNL